MGDPYLSSDESLILSTHHINVDGVSLDLMLTSRRLILIDNSVNPFLLHTIPLETIITVFAGTDVKGDPIITLSCMDISGTGAPHPMDFIFIRQKGDQRVKECNEWAASLSNHAAIARDGALLAGTLPYDPVKVIQPRMSATYRIEMFSPRKPVMDQNPERSAPVPSPVITQSPLDSGIVDGTGEPSPLEPAEMVERFDSSRLPPFEREDPVMPDAEEPVLSYPAIIDDSDQNPVRVDASRIWAGATRQETSHVPVSVSIPSLEETHAVESMDKKPTVASDQISAFSEEPVSSPQASAPASDENPVISDAAAVWADAVHTAISSPAVILPTPACTATPSGEPVSVRPSATADPFSTGTAEPVAGISTDISPVNTLKPDRTADDKPAGLPVVHETAPGPDPLSLPDTKTQKTKSSPLRFAAIVFGILIVLGVVVIGSFYLLGFNETPPPVVVPVVTANPSPTPSEVVVPADGVWVRVEYSQTFIGEVGNAEFLHPVSGSGVQFYKILWSDRIVQASAQKQDYSGDTLLVEVYNNGTLIKRSSTRVPMGGVTILIDPITGQPPGIRYGDIP